MPVTERLQGIGSWSLQLRDDTPEEFVRSLRLSTVGFGHVIVTPTWLDPTAVDGDGLLSRARFTGVFRSRPSRLGLAGPGLAMWLGDEDGKGRPIESGLANSSETFVNWIGDLIPDDLTSGTISAISGTLTHRFQYVTRRVAIDYVCDYFGAEWRINPDGSFDAGEPDDLFATTPTVVVVARTDGARDLNVTGIEGSVDGSDDLDDYTTRVVVLSTGDGNAVAYGEADISPATSYKNLQGNAVVLTRVVESADTTSGNEDAVAQAQLNRFTSSRRGLTLTSTEYDIGGKVEAGDTIWVYDPTKRGLVDLDNEIQYRGATIHPVELRVVGYTWPVRDGMGVYLRAPDASGTITDLTDWFVPESGGVAVEVGSKPRRLSSDSVYSATSRPGLAGPAGMVGYAQVTADQTGVSSETDLTSLSVTVNVGPGRRLRVCAAGSVVHDDAGSRAVGRIKESTTTLGAWLDNESAAAGEAHRGQGCATVTPSAGSHTYKLTLERSAGTGDVDLSATTSVPAWIAVEDVGPDPD